MFTALEQVNARPALFEHYTAADLWTDEHTSEQMLAYHLNGDVDLSSRKTAFIERSVDWIVSRFELGKTKRVADFGCGPGLYTNRLAKSGAAVTGIDFSARSIRYAREQAAAQELEVDYLQADYLEVETEQRFDLITMIMCDFCALSPAQRATLLKKLLGFLEAGGAVLLDAYTLAAFNAREEAATYAPDQLDGFWSAQPYFGFQNTFKYDDEKVVLDKYTIVEADRTWVVYNWLQYFSPQALEAEFSAAGFQIEETLGDVAGGPLSPDSTEFAVIARKPTR